MGLFSKKPAEGGVLNTSAFLHIPMPRSKKFKVINELTLQAESWRDRREHELEKKTWLLIAEMATKYANADFGDIGPDQL